jgi:hypothetical protein
MNYLVGKGERLAGMMITIRMNKREEYNAVVVISVRCEE